MGDAVVKNLSTTDNNDNKVVLVRKSMMVFFIGGAGDKRPFLGTGPNNNIVDTQVLFLNKYKKEIESGKIVLKYLGYYEVFGEDRIWAVLKDTQLFTELSGLVILKSNPIIVIGHSLGGWNGAHFASKLVKWGSTQETRAVTSSVQKKTIGFPEMSSAGFDVRMLITLDPVGLDLGMRMIADIYATEPKVNVKNWINLHYDQDGYSFPDFIADCGVQWKVKIGPRINFTVNVDHAFTKSAMTHSLNSKEETAFNEACKVIDEFIKE